MWGEVRHKKPRQRRVFVLLGELRCHRPKGYARGGSPPDLLLTKVGRSVIMIETGFPFLIPS